MKRIAPLLALLLAACTTAEIGSTERLSNPTRQQMIVEAIDGLDWIGRDDEYLQILEAVEAVQALSAVYKQIRDSALSLQFNPVQFDLLQSNYLAAAREYRQAREVIKARWPEFAPEVQWLLQGWDNDARLFGDAMNKRFLQISAAEDGYTQQRLWQDTLALMPTILAGAEILLPLAKTVF
jgi:hypothetical protein